MTSVFSAAIRTTRSDRTTTRPEFIAIVVRVLDLPLASPEATLPYEDVKPGNWFYGVVRQVYAAGFLEGNGSRLETMPCCHNSFRL